MEMNIPAPENWQTFESLCTRLWSSIWGSMAQKVGRSGQNQHGIDIIGTSLYDGGLCAVQCKLKNYNTGSQLTCQEIDKETENAKQFKPKLKHLTFATTMPRDIKLQQHCLELNSKLVKPYDVDIWSWDDIQAEIQYRKEIMDYFYHELPMEQKDIAVYDVFFTIPRLAAFFSRDNISRLFSSKDKNLLCNLAFELFDNAFKHGKATKFVLKIEDNKIWMNDNGSEFNSKDLTGKNGGSVTMQKVLERFDNVEYQFINNENSLSIALPDTIEVDEPIELVIDGSNIRNRDEIARQVMSIPFEVKNVIVNITALVPCSGADKFLKYLNTPNRKITVYLPHEYPFTKMLKESYPNMIFIER